MGKFFSRTLAVTKRSKKKSVIPSGRLCAGRRVFDNQQRPASVPDCNLSPASALPAPSNVMREAKRSLIEIAFKVGYTSPSAFAKSSAASSASHRRSFGVRCQCNYFHREQLTAVPLLPNRGTPENVGMFDIQFEVTPAVARIREQCLEVGCVVMESQSFRAETRIERHQQVDSQQIAREMRLLAPAGSLIFQARKFHPSWLRHTALGCQLGRNVGFTW